MMMNCLPLGSKRQPVVLMQGGQRAGEWRREGVGGEDLRREGEGWRGEGVGGENPRDWGEEGDWRNSAPGGFNGTFATEQGTYLGITQPYPESETYSIEQKPYLHHPYSPPSPPNRLNPAGSGKYPDMLRYPDVRRSHRYPGPDINLDDSYNGPNHETGYPGPNAHPANLYPEQIAQPHPDRYPGPDMYPADRYQTGSSVQSDPYPNSGQNRSYYLQVITFWGITVIIKVHR